MSGATAVSMSSIWIIHNIHILHPVKTHMSGSCLKHGSATIHLYVYIYQEVIGNGLMIVGSG